MQEHWDIIIIGAGPAGMSAAIAASRNNASVLVVDRSPNIGGQIYRNIENVSSDLQAFFGKEFSKGMRLAQEFRACPASVCSDTTVWGIDTGVVYVSRNGVSSALHADTIIIATGALERPAPVTGWNLPGVMGAGAADLLLKNSGVVPDGPVVLCGNGPLLLQSAVHLTKLGVEVSGMLCTSSSQNFLRASLRFPLALSRPLYFAKGAGMMGSIIRARIPHFSGVSNIVISQGTDELGISFTSKGQNKQLSVATVLLHEGVIPDTRLSRLAGCIHDWNPLLRCWTPRTTQWGESSQAGVRIVGDGAGVLGAEAAAALGTLAALDVCHKATFITRNERDEQAEHANRLLTRVRFAQPLLDQYFCPSPSALSPSDDTIVCRCEELTAGTLREYIRNGSLTPDGVKAQSRSGMGQCQGRMCEHAILELIAEERGVDHDLITPLKIQAPIFPIPLGELSDLDL